MKKGLIIVALIFAGFAFNSCEEDCAMCREVTYDADNNIVSEGTSKEYCGTELDEIESEEPVTIGGLTTKWECE